MPKHAHVNANIRAVQMDISLAKKYVVVSVKPDNVHQTIPLTLAVANVNVNKNNANLDTFSTTQDVIVNAKKKNALKTIGLIITYVTAYVTKLHVLHTINSIN